MKTPKSSIRLIALMLPLLVVVGCVSPRHPTRHYVEIRNDATRTVVLEHKLDPEWSTCDVDAAYHELAPAEAKRIHGTGKTTFLFRPIEDSGHWGKASPPVDLSTGHWVMTVREVDQRLYVSLTQVPPFDSPPLP